MKKKKLGFDLLKGWSSSVIWACRGLSFFGALGGCVILVFACVREAHADFCWLILYMKNRTIENSLFFFYLKFLKVLFCV